MLPVAPLDETESGATSRVFGPKVTETCQNSLAHWATTRFVWGVDEAKNRENERIHFTDETKGFALQAVSH
jgi:hypothetical protein